MPHRLALPIRSEIRFSSILSLTPYKVGVAIEKATGKSPTLVIQEDAKIVTAKRHSRERGNWIGE